MEAYGNKKYDYRGRSNSPDDYNNRNYYQHDERESRSPMRWKHDKYEKFERGGFENDRYDRNNHDKRDRDKRTKSKSSDRDDMKNKDYENRNKRDSNDYDRETDQRFSNDRSNRNHRGRESSHDGDHSRHDRRRERKSRSRSRDRGRSRSWERNRSRSRSRDRERKRYSREKDRRDRYEDDRDRRSYYDDEEAIDSLERQNITDYKSQTPNKTIMIRGLAQHITENDIRQDLVACGFTPSEIRHVRNRRTGASRGFAFVEFPTLEESIQWMEMKQGVLMLQNKYRGVLVYGILKDSTSSALDKSGKNRSGWYCVKCATYNFRRRSKCYGCSASRVESEDGGCGNDEVCQYATKTIMLRNLDALTTEDSVMAVLKTVAEQMIKFINGILISRDPLTQTSRGVCYLDMETTVEALSLHGILTALTPPLTIDNKRVSISYCKYRMGDTNEIYPQAAFNSASTAQTYTMNDLNALADYSASRYAKTPVQYQHYFEYYKTYFSQQISQGVAISLAQESQANSVNAAAAVAHSAMLQRQRKLAADKSAFRIPTGTDGKAYPIPEISSYIYDESTGYYYDSSTGLYYDANSQYYYNSVIQKYLYWDGSQMTYLLAPTQSTTVAAAAVTTGMNPTTTVAPNDDTNKEKKKTKPEKQDKAKVAKKIAKDMERWAKTMSKNKEQARATSTNEYMANAGSSGHTAASADIGFAVLEKKAAVGPSYRNHSPTTSNLVAAYGGGSDTSGEEDNNLGLIEGLDWENLICVLCKRKFNSKDGLAKHQKVSELHRTNLEQYCIQHGIDKDKGQSMKYRDRAKERREKFGESDDPVPSALKEKYLKAIEAAEPIPIAQPNAPISSDNVGSKLLQKMGWSEGQGLGKTNQGRTTIIQAEQRGGSTVGLGAKGSSYTALPGESYKDVVKKMMYARYQEINDR